MANVYEWCPWPVGRESYFRKVIQGNAGRKAWEVPDALVTACAMPTSDGTFHPLASHTYEGGKDEWYIGEPTDTLDEAMASAEELACAVIDRSANEAYIGSCYGLPREYWSFN